VSKAKAKETTPTGVDKAAPKKAAAKPKAKPKKDSSVEEIVSEATSAVDLAAETDAEPVTSPIVLPKDALVINHDEDDIPVQNLAITGATADPVKDYLKQIGKVALLNAELEVELAKRIEAGLFAEEKLATDGKLAAADRRDLELGCKRRQAFEIAPSGSEPSPGGFACKAIHRTRHAIPRFDSRGKPRLDSRG